MYLKNLKLKNWRNFREAEIFPAQISYLIGPNASGKSNLMDVFRFMRDICRPDGGGLQKAVKDRGGIQKLRCLHHRRDTEVSVEVGFSEKQDSDLIDWKYILAFRPEGKGAQRLLVSREEVWCKGRLILQRPNTDDGEDSLLLTETHLEQTLANREFRIISDFFSEITYLHLIPQLLRYGDQIGGNRLEEDPFGQGFLERLATCQKRTRDVRLRKIKEVLALAVPQFRDLRFIKDNLGHPHLEALYAHHRPNAGWQSEEHFSDGTLRLIGILWVLLEGRGLLLLEEPELSLHEAIVEQIPLFLDRAQRDRSGKKRQIFISTHSEALLRNPGVDAGGIMVLEPGTEGSTIRKVSENEDRALDAGLTIADVVFPKTRPKGVEQMVLWE
ncbi:AAA family ATPase [Desulfobotulus mexicanus]|uniref:AAA family ATPase n=1 Tax=Desulfobotulus mexicanus TaxID=2586642 RepID=A0A5Q4VGG4_9BACT|nr:AAA family ATPase [Desulfobotulus mexicanus]TYT76028.1 AAA family ATPase [Desulfobotulus mexicanus]